MFTQSRKPIIGAIGSILIVALTMLSACAPDVAHAANVAAAAFAQSVSDNPEAAAAGASFTALTFIASMAILRG